MSGRREGARPRVLGAAGAVAAAAVLALAGPAGTGATVARAADGPDTVRFSIGTSVRGRPITVVHRAYAGAATRVVVIGSIHGDERAGQRVVSDLRLRDLPANVDLWLIRTVNPDGVVADRRTNAHRVDLNRNFPYHWRHFGAGTETYSGPERASEPETRALKAFVTKIDPRLVVVFHQPLFGIGADDKDMPVVRALARGMRLPVRNLVCGGVCHGTFTSWFNHRSLDNSIDNGSVDDGSDGLALTVEFGRTASDTRIRRAARTLLDVGAGL